MDEIVPNANRWIEKGRSRLFMANDQSLLIQGAKDYAEALKKGLK